jgi:hypothetical protein
MCEPFFMEKSTQKIIFFYKKPFSLILTLGLTALFILENINGQFGMHDFEVYYSAGRAFLSGSSVYGQAFGLSSGFFKYAPVTLLFFSPLSLLPFTLAKVIYYFFLVFVSVSTFLLLSLLVSDNFYRQKEKSASMILLLALVITGGHLYREMGLGNVNILLLLIFSFAFRKLERGKSIQAGLLMGAGALLKLHFLVLLPLLLVRRKIKSASAFLLLLLAGLSLPYLITGFTNGAMLNSEWVDAVRAHNQSLLNYPDTLYAILYNGMGRFLFSQPGQLFAFGILGCVGVIFLFFIFRNMRQEKQAVDPIEGERLSMTHFCFEYFLLIAAIPNLMATDTEHFLFSLPLILFSLQFLKESARYKTMMLYVLLCFFSYCDFGNDILGKELSTWLEMHGFTGLGNIFILLVSLLVFFRVVKQNESPDLALSNTVPV